MLCYVMYYTIFYVIESTVSADESVLTDSTVEALDLPVALIRLEPQVYIGF